MTESPFAIFRPYGDGVHVRLYGRADGIASRADVERSEGMPVADCEQTHGPLTVRADAPGTSPAADGVATDAHGFALSTRSADCQSFAVYDTALHVGGVLHSGWPGLVKGAIPGFVETMRREWGSDPANLVIGVGPSLCLACSQFTDPLRELPTIDPHFFRERLVDLRGIADDQWMSLGVRPGNIERHPDCTKCNVDRWWSLRGGDKEALSKGSRNALTFSLI
jgi:copper oxidase (laccase) domain-containing protein